MVTLTKVCYQWGGNSMPRGLLKLFSVQYVPFASQIVTLHIIFHEEFSFRLLLFIWIQHSYCSEVNMAQAYMWWNDSPSVCYCSFPKSRAKDRVKLLLSEEMNIRVGVILCTRNTNRPLAMISHSFLLYFWLRVYTLKNTQKGVLYKTNSFTFDASRVNMAYRGLFEILTERSPQTQGDCRNAV